jgi:hypothetical protein
MKTLERRLNRPIDILGITFWNQGAWSLSGRIE